MTRLVKTFPEHRRAIPKAAYVFMTSKTAKELSQAGFVKPAIDERSFPTLHYPDSERFMGAEIIIDDDLEQNNWLYDRPSAEIVPKLLRGLKARQVREALARIMPAPWERDYL